MTSTFLNSDASRARDEFPTQAEKFSPAQNEAEDELPIKALRAIHAAGIDQVKEIEAGSVAIRFESLF